MFVWRICAARYRDSAFSGIGGLYVPGRWHSKGIKVVYTSETLALSSLEIFVHLESDNVSLIAMKAHLEDSLKVTEITTKSLPDNWQEPEAYKYLQKLGMDWLKKGSTPILKVPSAIVPVEFNYLLNPTHPQLQFELEPAIEFKFDRRMWKR